MRLTSILHWIVALIVLVPAGFGRQASSPASASQAAPQPAPQAAPATPGFTLAASATALAAGDSHSCAIANGGKVRCWGTNDAGQFGASAVSGYPSLGGEVEISRTVTAVAAGLRHTCALTDAGTVQCWGANAFGQLGDGTTITRTLPATVTGLGSGVLAIAAGGNHTCAIKATGGGTGAVLCWGENTRGELGDGSLSMRSVPVSVLGLGLGMTAVAAGAQHSCAVYQDGQVKCWGANDMGQLGDGTTISRPLHVTVLNLGGAAASLAAGGQHTCALLAGGTLRCWGANASGQLGDGGTIRSLNPAMVIGLGGPALGVTAGENHTCARLASGAGVCWGDNRLGQLGDGTYTNQPAPVTALGAGVQAIAAGQGHTCAVTGFGAVACWGDNTLGQLGNGRRLYALAPVTVPGFYPGATQLFAGAYQACANSTWGADVRCWGANFSGSLGDGTVAPHYVPSAGPVIPGGLRALAMGERHTCALNLAGAVYCWGDNLYFQVGDGTRIERHAPTAVPGLDGLTPQTRVTQLAAGAYHTCALIETGAVRCWGGDFLGQLGDTGYVDRPDPQDVHDLSAGVTAIAAGDYHTCAYAPAAGASTSHVLCWGYNSHGQLGDDSDETRPYPVRVVGVNEVLALAAGGAFTCAITPHNALRCWGENASGQLGDETHDDRWTAGAVTGLVNDVQQIALGGKHACALVYPGLLRCWGDNLYGQVGDTTTISRTVPTVVSGLHEISRMVAGEAFTCALSPAGGLSCWGSGYSGQLGDGRQPTTPYPVGVVSLTGWLGPGVSYLPLLIK